MKGPGKEDGQEEGREEGGLSGKRDGDSGLRHELERIADLLTEAAGALRKLAGDLSAPPVPAPGEQQEAAESVEEEAGAAGPAPQPLPERGDPPPFLEEIMPAAARVLRAEPGRVWQSGDLTRNVLEEAGAGDREDIRWSGDLPFFLTRRLAVRGFLERFGEDRYRVPTEPQGTEDEAGGMRAEVVRLEQEIDSARRYLPTLDRRERTSQVALWAGQARALQDRADQFDEAWATRLRRVFGRLSSIIREQDCGWVSALNREWETDWEVYTAIHRGILNSMPPYLDVEQEAAYCRDELEALFFEGRHVERAESDALLLDALGVMPEDDDLLGKALEQFGDPRRPMGSAARASSGSAARRSGGRPSAAESGGGREETEVSAEVVDLQRRRHQLEQLL